jgi:hypothetical protein
MAFGKFSKGGGKLAYDSVKQGLANTTSGGNKTGQGNKGQNTKAPSVVETSTTADRPIFYSSKKV